MLYGNDVNLDRITENPLVHSILPVSIPLWDHQLLEDRVQTLAEKVNDETGIIESVSEPTLTVFTRSE